MDDGWDAARRQRRWQDAPSERLTTEDGEAEHGLRPSRMLAREEGCCDGSGDGGPLSRSAGTIRRRARPMQVPAL